MFNQNILSMWTRDSFQLREPRAFATWQKYPGISGQYVPCALGLRQGGDLSRLADTMRSVVRLKGSTHNSIFGQQEAQRLLESRAPSTATLSFDHRTPTTIPYLPLWAHSKINCVEDRSDSGTGGSATLDRSMITIVSNTPANQFVCSYSSCVDKHTRRRRSFRRRDHL